MRSLILSAAALLMGSMAHAQETAPTVDELNEEVNIFDTLFGEDMVTDQDLNLCEEVDVVNPGFGFGAQDFNTDCPDQIILRNKGLSSESYEVTAVRTDPPIAHNRAVLKALDKLTGRLTEIEIGLGDFALFETLIIEANACYKNPETETPENAAFLQVVDTISGQDEDVFSGWMYASSPSLNAMEHAVYDVWVVDCKN